MNNTELILGIGIFVVGAIVAWITVGGILKMINNCDSITSTIITCGFIMLLPMISIPIGFFYGLFGKKKIKDD
mgnify:CR=1 FL=1